MIRATGIAAVVMLAMAGAVQADESFDATGQFFFSFDFSVTGKEEVKPRFGVRFGSSNLGGVQGNNDTRLDSNYDAFGISFGETGSALSVGHARIKLEDGIDTENVELSPTAEPLYPMRGVGSHFDSFSAPRVRDANESFALDAIKLEPAEPQPADPQWAEPQWAEPQRAEGVFHSFKPDPSITGTN